MANQSWQSACDKGHNWITKLKTAKSGYNKIRPRILPKGLSTFKKEHCAGFEDNEEGDNFFRSRERIHSVDIIDCRLREEMDEYLKNKKFSRSMDLQGL